MTKHSVLVNLADLWLHLVRRRTALFSTALNSDQGTRSVLYLELRPEQPSQAFTLGRAFNSTCLSNPSGIFNDTIEGPTSCMIDLIDANLINASAPQLLNETEFFRTAANTSNVNLVYLSDGYAVLGPAKPPLDLDFQATGFGSQTSCRAITGLCDTQSTEGDELVWPSNFNFVCNATVAGLNMTGNFLDVLALPGSGPAVTNATQGNKTDPYQVVLGGNTINGNSYSIGFQYFNDSQRLEQTPILNPYYGTGGEDRHQLYWALVWWAPFTTVLTNGGTPLGMNATLISDTPVTNETAAVGGSIGSREGSLGILSCETNISEVVRCSLTNSRDNSGNVSTDLLLQ